MSKFEKFCTAHDSAMKAIIIYDNFAFAAKANEMLLQAARQADASIYWNIRPWRIDTLNLHRGAEDALADALDAHLIVFAGHRAQSLPLWLLDWLEQWVECRQIKDAAFAVIGGRNGDAFLMPATPELSLFARQHGLSFITDGGLIVNGGEQLSISSEPDDEVTPSLARSRFMDVPVGSDCRGWGIND